MPILEIPTHNSPLTQGDIFKGINLHETAPDGTSSSANPKYCMIVSRPCAAAHKARVVVVGVEKYKTEKPNITKYTEVLDFLEGIRTGDKQPDCFYVGQVPGAEPGRYRAKLDAFYTIQLPQSLDEIINKRISRLTAEFARDLHTRLFHAFASLGFEDYGWYSDDDLRWVIGAARKDIADIEYAVATKAAEGTTPELTKIRQQLDERRAEIAPLETEFAKRKLTI